MTQDDMNILVPKKLHELEQRRNIKIIFAVELGSRAWQLYSPGSDFDVRFIYFRDKDEYLRVFGIHESIKLPIDDTWDVCGWDIARFLRFLYSSKAIPYECLRSGVRYLDRDFSWKIAPLMRKYFSGERMLCDYVEIIKSNRLERRKILYAKHYFYMLRPILAALWILEKNTPPPVQFGPLSVMLPECLRVHVDRLFDIRVNAPEKTEIARVSELDEFMYGKFEELTKIAGEYDEGNKKLPVKNWKALNRFFREVIGV